MKPPKIHPPNNYDDCLPHKMKPGRRHPTVGDLKAERLRVLNERRAKNGLPPKEKY